MLSRIDHQQFSQQSVQAVEGSLDRRTAGLGTFPLDWTDYHVRSFGTYYYSIRQLWYTYMNEGKKFQLQIGIYYSNLSRAQILPFRVRWCHKLGVVCRVCYWHGTRRSPDDFYDTARDAKLIWDLSLWVEHVISALSSSVAVVLETSLPPQSKQSWLTFKKPSKPSQMNTQSSKQVISSHHIPFPFRPTQFPRLPRNRTPIDNRCPPKTRIPTSRK